MLSQGNHMIAFLNKYSTIILLSILLILLALARIFPTVGLKLGIIFLFVCFFIASLVVLEKHKNAYRKGEITQSIFIRNAVLEISGTWIVMVLAGLLGRAAAGAITQPI